MKIYGRLGFSLDLSKDELQTLTGKDREAATDLLVSLIRSNQFDVVGDTYFPVEWNENTIVDELCFDLSLIFPENRVTMVKEDDEE